MIRRFGLLGENLSHSFSPIIHAELGDYQYRLYEKKPDELEVFLRQGDFEGLNITIPYKKSVIPFCKDLCKNARTIGSVNTITKLSDGSLYGSNTDYYGFAYILKKTGINPAAGKTIILGSGGSSLAVQAVLHDMGAKEIAVVSRSGQEHKNVHVSYKDINKHDDAILLVNTTPVGMFPETGISPLPDLGIFRQCRAVIDLIYNPARTELLLQAEEQGILAFNGLAMLVAQAKNAAEIFTGTFIHDDIIESILNKIKQQTRNIVLIGMPGCGKSSIGKALADKMGRTFADTDEWIIKTAAKPIPAIITEDGEESFRKLEKHALTALCKQSSLVIATGGGVITQPGNRRIIRQNGIMVFLDRDIDQLSVSGRPLSQRNGVEALARERLPLYSEWSDYMVRVCGKNRTEQIEQTVLNIYKQFGESI